VGDAVLPMELTFSAPPATRLRQLLVLLLLALALLAGVSVSQSRDVEARIVHTEVVTLPAVLQLHELANRIDDQRGMAAHCTSRCATRLTARRWKSRLQASRQQVERRMAAHARRLQSDAERQHHAVVQASLAAFWAAQDELLALHQAVPRRTLRCRPAGP
jgi:urease accessory protein UreF